MGQTVGISSDLIIHPGETLEEVLENRNMTPEELALRTGMAEQQIHRVLQGQEGITLPFARKLEHALGIEAFFWIHLQENYDREFKEYEEAVRC